ncbi:type II and III secretion system protein family protein [Thiohalobacter thiocyanaticus]|uniref:Type II and III secretion system protein family protein n=1 Tax=Thiohalobacter thiocyanaticus TaxID=585455 RepID=A0A426QMR9_9GAMM|nr:type II and III secretion system protein family protein [Thiohalobacter thiocyanaticus]RRQ23052.1 type II and III secretion system protein family protein [Thiohalobacter thiocyanaticus]
MNNRDRVRAHLLLKACLLLCLALGQGLAVAANRTLEIPLAQQQNLSYSQPVARLALGEPEIADVQAVGSRDVLITSRKLGSTSLKVWLQGGEVRSYRIRVVPAEETTAALGGTGMQLVPSGEGVALTGETNSLPEHAAARTAAGQDVRLSDRTRSGFSHQVQTDIRIVEISHNKLKEIGFFLSKVNRNTAGAVAPPGVLSGVSGGAGGFSLSSGSGFLPSINGFNLVFGRARDNVLGVLSVLEGNGFAYTLAEPSLVTLSGQQASFLVGGEFPIPIRQGSGSDASVSIEYKEFGIRLFLTPTVLAEDQIMLRVAPEVSELDFSTGIETGGVSVPSLRVRRTETSVELGDGESFVISGLMSRETISNVDKVPGLGDLPVLGAFFRSSRLDMSDRELIMVVTPRLVSPLAADAELPPMPGEAYREYDPSFSEFALPGMSGGGAQDANYGFSD